MLAAYQAISVYRCRLAGRRTLTEGSSQEDGEEVLGSLAI